MAFNSTINRVMTSGTDESLGRWSWITLQGKINITTTIVTGYRPCDNTSGNNNLILQQQQYLQAKQIEECPCEVWIQDLGTLITNKLHEGHQIVLLAGMNDSVVNCKRLHTRSERIGLKEVYKVTCFTLGTGGFNCIPVF